MWKLLGFITGCALVLAPGLLMLDRLPQLQPAQRQATVTDSAIRPESAMDTPTPASAPGDLRDHHTPGPTSPIPVALPDAKPEIPSPASAPAAPTQLSHAPSEQAEATNGQPAAAANDREAAITVAKRLHLFWSPFRNEYAARGFARRLTRVSGIEIKLAESGPAHYRVGFSYSDDLHRNWCLGQIQARTGLDLGVQPMEMETAPGPGTDLSRQPAAEPGRPI